MTMLLSSDWHLTDDPTDEYRWRIFDHVRECVEKNNVRQVGVLGDIAHKKDRHSGALVNRLVSELKSIDAEFTILCGNHDRPLNGPPFWTFLSEVENVHFITSVLSRGKTLWLAHSANPSADWADIRFTSYKAVFMHQTVTGVVEKGIRLAGDPGMIELPRRLKVYSGDIHTPQTVGNVEFVGAPHPVKFGDEYRCRMLLLDDEYDIEKEIILDPPRKLILNLSSLDDLRKYNVRQDDQAEIRFTIDPDRIEQWPVERQAILDWAAKQGISVADIEAEVALEPGDDAHQAVPILDADQLETLKAFAKSEGLSKALLDVGSIFVKESSNRADRMSALKGETDG
jgi:hypothetical protein